MFESFDLDNSGDLNTQEMQAMFSSFGLGKTGSLDGNEISRKLGRSDAGNQCCSSYHCGCIGFPGCYAGYTGACALGSDTTPPETEILRAHARQRDTLQTLSHSSIGALDVCAPEKSFVPAPGPNERHHSRSPPCG